MTLLKRKMLNKIGVVVLVTVLINSRMATVYGNTKEEKTNFTITYNPGHGGKDPGYVGWIMNEKDVCKDIAKGFKKGLDSFGVDNATANDPGSNINKRIAFAKKKKSLNIEIHNNGVANPDSEGFEVFVENFSNKELISSLSKFAKSVSSKLGMKNRGVKQDKSSVRKKLGATYLEEDSIGILIEDGFLSNKKDTETLNTEEKRLMHGYILAVDLLSALNVISEKDANDSIINFAGELDLIEKKVTVDELIEKMKAKVYKAEEERKEKLSSENAFNKLKIGVKKILSNVLGDDDSIDSANQDKNTNITEINNNLNNDSINKVETQDNTSINYQSEDKKESVDSIDSVEQDVLEQDVIEQNSIEENNEENNVKQSVGEQVVVESLAEDDGYTEELQDIVQEKIDLIKENYYKEEHSNDIIIEPNTVGKSKDNSDDSPSDEE